MGHESSREDNTAFGWFERGVKSAAAKRSSAMPYKALEPPLPEPMNGTKGNGRRPDSSITVSR